MKKMSPNFSFLFLGAATASLIIGFFVILFFHPSVTFAVDYPSPSPSPTPSPSPSPAPNPSPSPAPAPVPNPASSSSFMASSPSLKGLNEGDMIRASSLMPPDGWAIYVVNKFGFKRHIFNPDVFNMYKHLKWENVKDVSPSFLDGFTTSMLYRTEGDSKIFSLDINGVKHWLNMTPEQFITRGENWNAIFVINSSENAYYSMGSDITPTTINPPPPPAPSHTDVTASLSPLNPSSATIGSGTVFNTLLSIRLTAGSQPVSLNGITITKKGLIANTSVTSISIWNGSTRLGNVLTALTSEGKATFMFPTPLTINPNAGVDLDIKAGISSAISSGTVSMTVDNANDIQASTTNILGLFPLAGNTFNIVSSGQLGAFTLSAQSVGGNSGSFSSSGSGNLEIGVVQKELGRFQVTESTGHEDLLVQNITIFSEGSAQANDFANWTLNDASGAKLASGNVMMPYIMFTLSTPLRIPSGTNRTFSLRADPVNGADRTIRLHIQNDFDLMVKGSLTQSFIAPSNFSDTAGSDGYWRIKQGALTVSLTPGSPSGNVAVGAQETTLAKFDVRATGEQLEIRKMDVQIVEATLNSGQQLTGNVKIQSDDGNSTYVSIAASTANLQKTSDTEVGINRFDLSNFLTIPAGTTKTIKVVTTIPTTATSTQTYKAKIGFFQAFRSSTQDFIDIFTTNYTSGNTLTVQTSALSVGSNSSVANQNVAPGANNALLGSFVFQAGAAEGINVSGITLIYGGSGSASTDLTNVSLCVDKGGSQASGSCSEGPQFGTTLGTPNTSDSFNGSLMLNKNETTVVNVRGHINTSATNGNTIMTKISGVSATGQATSNTVVATNTSGSPISSTNVIQGQTFTYSQGSLTITKEGAPTTKIITSGSTGVILDRIKFSALNDNLTLQTIRFRTSLTGTSTAGGGAYIKKTFLMDGSTNLTPSGVIPIPNGASSEILFSGLSVNIPAGTPKFLTLNADMSDSSVITSATDVGTFAVSIKSNTSSDDLQITGTRGILNASAINGGAASDIAPSDVFLFHAAQPIIALAPSSPSGTQSPQSNQEVFSFTVKSSTQGISLRIPRVRIRVSLSPVNGWTGTLGSWDLFDGPTRIARNTSLTLSSSNTSGVLTFDNTNEISSGFTANGNATDVTNGTFGRVASDATPLTFTVKVDTSAIKTSSASTPGNAVLSFKVDGLTGFTTSGGTVNDPNDATVTATSTEDNWAGGGIFYAYQLFNSANFIGGLDLPGNGALGFNASDSYPIIGSTLTY